MEAITRNIRDIETGERRVLEHILGRQLQENQQIIIQVVTPAIAPAEECKDQGATSSESLPEWTRVYEGLMDEQIAEVEQIILQRADLTRPSE